MSADQKQPPMTAQQIAVEIYARGEYDSREAAYKAVMSDPLGCRRMLAFLRETQTFSA